jgi:rubrerythrin
MTEDILALPQAWRMAIQREQDAHDFYVRMARTATDPSAKALFEELAAEETKHRQRLEAEYRRVFERDMEEPRQRLGIFEHDLKKKKSTETA